MILNLYLFVEGTDIMVISGQLDGFKDLETANLTIAPGSNIVFKNKDQVYAKVDSDLETVVEIIKKIPIDEVITTKMCEDARKFNNLILNNDAPRTSKYPIPKDLFIPQITWDLITTGIDIGLYPLLFGPTGSGKTKTAQSVADAMDMEFFPINCGSIFKPKQTLIGTIQAKEGSTYLVDSEFLKYFTSEKRVIIFLNEISRIPTGAANYLMTVLDRLQSYLYIEEEGRRVYKGENVTFIADANFGFEYADTRTLDNAFINRFVKMMVNYLPPEEEIELIMQMVPGSIKSNIKKLVENSNKLRKEKDQLRVSISTRNLLDFSKFMAAGFSFTDVMDNLFKNLFINGSVDERERVEILLDGLI